MAMANVQARTHQAQVIQLGKKKTASTASKKKTKAGDHCDSHAQTNTKAETKSKNIEKEETFREILFK